MCQPKYFMGFADGSMVKNLPSSTGDPGSIPGEGNGNFSSILAWEILWTEGPGQL